MENGCKNPVYYLSTNIVPIHRFERIETLKRIFKCGKRTKKVLPPILIATQVVEAGVDLDFDMGFRDVGPIDSIIQVAGRINRNNDPNKKDSPLYIVDFGDADKIYGTITHEQSKKALLRKEIFHERDYLSLVNQYFDYMSNPNQTSFSEFREIFYAMKSLEYDTVAKFKIIDESFGTSTVYIEFDDEVDYKEKHLQMLTGEITKEKFDRDYKRAFQQRIIAVPTHLTQDLDFLHELEEKVKIVPKSSLQDYYNLSNGFNRDQQPSYAML